LGWGNVPENTILLEIECSKYYKMVGKCTVGVAYGGHYNVCVQIKFNGIIALYTKNDSE